MEFINAKTIMAKVKYGNGWFGIDYNMNLYRGCSHGCIYCDSRSNCYKIDNFDKVRSKKDCLLILENELRKNKRGIIGIGAMSDTYNPFEKEYLITRSALELVEKYQYGCSIDTKSPLITRDIDLLKKINENNGVIVKFTVTTCDDELSKKIEPHVAVSSERFKAIKALSDAGIFTGVLLNPVLPFITDNEENIKEIVRLAYENGAKFIYTYMGMTLRENQRIYYYEKLDQLFPGLKEKYRRTYDVRYQCAAVNHQRLFLLFTKECKKYGLLYKMKDIISAYKVEEKEIEQLSLFD